MDKEITQYHAFFVFGNMSVDFFQRIAYRLTRATVIVAFVLGIVISIAQVFIDFKKQQSTIDQTAQEIFNVAEKNAARIAYQLDDNYAQELVEGLKKYQVLFAARLLDDKQNLLAEFSGDLSNLELSPVTQALAGHTSLYRYPLTNDKGLLTGYLELTTDNHQALVPFYNRASYVFWAGLVRNLILATILLVLFYSIVTKPLMDLAKRVSLVQSNQQDDARVEMIDEHRKSEIGYIIDSINQFISTSDDSQKKLTKLEQQLRLITNTVPMMIFAVDQRQKLLFANINTGDFYNQAAEQLLGHNPVLLQEAIEPMQGLELDKHIQVATRERKIVVLEEFLLTNKLRQTRVFEASFLPLNDTENNAVLAVFNDVTDRVESQKVIKHMAYHDSLTGLVNRTYFQQQLLKDIQTCKDNGNIGTVMFIDLDKFKLVNDTLGHTVGDRVLMDVANKLKDLSEPGATLARIGGDEFALSFPRLAADPEQANMQALQIAERINTALNNEINLVGQGYQICASIGVVCYPHASDDATDLLQYADAALYQAKSDGRNRVKLFEPQIIDKLTEQVQIEQEVRRGIKNDEFTIHLQPIIDGDSLQPIAAEALIRWQHPERGLLTPYHFLDCIESLNLAHHLSNLVIRECANVANLIGVAKLLQRNFRFSVNISTLEFYEPDFTQRIEQKILSVGLPFELFELEITESIALHDFELANQKLKQLSQLGLRIALDDFGTGYSSLSYLKNLDIDKVKVDKSFIDSIAQDRQDQKLIDSIITIARNFDLKVVVEGVETEQQLDWLSQYQDVWYQGYYFAKPKPEQAFVDYFSLLPQYHQLQKKKSATSTV